MDSNEFDFGFDFNSIQSVGFGFDERFDPVAFDDDIDERMLADLERHLSEIE